MIALRVLTVGAVSFCLAACSSHRVSIRSAMDVSRELQGVRAVWDEASSAFAAKDWARYADTWAHEPQLQVIHPSARDWIVGWDTLKRATARFSPPTLTGSSTHGGSMRRFRQLATPLTARRPIDVAGLLNAPE